jgi:hypothetical protein
MYHKLRSELQIFLMVVIKNQEPIEMHYAEHEQRWKKKSIMTTIF